jgi:hypothetical protein
MMKVVEVSFAPGVVTAGTNISLPSGSPPISKIVSCIIFRGSDATVAASVLTPTATKVDDNTITLNTDTTDRDLVVLRYIPKGAIRALGFN